MIIWIASFPRSGNTFLRIVLNRLYGVRTSTVYDIDGVADRLGHDFVGFEERPATYDVMRKSPDQHFVKTHLPCDQLVRSEDRVICLVRDGRDSMVSWARQLSERPGRNFYEELSTLVTQPDKRRTGQWGRNVLSWLKPKFDSRVVLRYEDLIEAPNAIVERAISTLFPEMQRARHVIVPTFDELQSIDDRFFRRGITGTYRDEFPDELHEQFWSQLDNSAAMTLLGYDKCRFPSGCYLPEQGN